MSLTLADAGLERTDLAAETRTPRPNLLQSKLVDKLPTPWLAQGTNALPTVRRVRHAQQTTRQQRLQLVLPQVLQGSQSNSLGQSKV